MSVASVKNGSLQLSELVISNEKYSNATGYVASSSSFSSSVSGTELTLGADPVSVNLSCNGAGSLIVAGTLTTLGNATFESGEIVLGELGVTGPVSLLCSAPGTLFVSGNVRGAMSKVTFNVDIDLNAGEAFSAQTTLPNFTGSASSAYVASCNFAGALGLIVSVDFVSASSGNTLVQVYVLNNTAGSINQTGLPFSVIGMA